MFGIYKLKFSSKIIILEKRTRFFIEKNSMKENEQEFEKIKENYYKLGNLEYYKFIENYHKGRIRGPLLQCEPFF